MILTSWKTGKKIYISESCVELVEGWIGLDGEDNGASVYTKYGEYRVKESADWIVTCFEEDK